MTRLTVPSYRCTASIIFWSTGSNSVRIPISNQLRRALQVGEQHGDLFALALQRILGQQDAFGQVLGRVLLCGGEARDWWSVQRGAALAAEPLLGRVARTTRAARGGQPRAAFTAELLRGWVLVPAARALHSSFREAIENLSLALFCR